MHNTVYTMIYTYIVYSLYVCHSVGVQFSINICQIFGRILFVYLFLYFDVWRFSFVWDRFYGRFSGFASLQLSNIFIHYLFSIILRAAVAASTTTTAALLRPNRFQFCDKFYLSRSSKLIDSLSWIWWQWLYQRKFTFVVLLFLQSHPPNIFSMMY